jgi:predicted DsbA family dithiol-disulfide isomerase
VEDLRGHERASRRPRIDRAAAMKVEIWSDVVCPWCYIGKRRFERALEQFDGAANVEVEWRSFQLNPDHPRGEREPLEASLAAKLGGSIAQVREMNDRVTRLAADEGLEYHLERYQVVNTFDAHRLTHLAKGRSLGPAAHERLLRAQLVEGESLDDLDTLVRLGEDVGIPAADTRRALETDAHAADVAEDLALARAFGISGVPFFVIDRRFGVSGAQPTDLFLEVLQTARADADAGAGAAVTG